MAVVTLPTKVYFSKVEKLQLMRAGVSLKSRYTGKRQVVNFPFAMWVFEGTLVPMSDLDAGEWRAFLTSLEGQRNTFRLPVPGSNKPLSGYTGNATLGTGGVAVRAKSMPVTGPANTLLLRKGDYFNLGDELKVADTSVTTNGAGVATVSFQPGARRAYAAGQAITIQNPFIYLAASDDDSGSWSLDRPVKHGIKLVCAEAIE
jgi:hypothetical protein